MGLHSARAEDLLGEGDVSVVSDYEKPNESPSINSREPTAVSDEQARQMIHAPDDERSSFRWSRMFRGARLPGDEETWRPFGWRSVAIPPAPFGTARTPQLGPGAGWY